MRIGIVLLILLCLAFAHLHNPTITMTMLLIFGFALMVGAANWKPGAIILAGVIVIRTGANVNDIARNLAPLGVGVMLGAGLQKGKRDDQPPEPVRGISVSGERGAHTDVAAGPDRSRPDRRNQNTSDYGRDRRQAYRDRPDLRSNGRWEDRRTW